MDVISSISSTKHNFQHCQLYMEYYYKIHIGTPQILLEIEIKYITQSVYKIFSSNNYSTMIVGKGILHHD